MLFLLTIRLEIIFKNRSPLLFHNLFICATCKPFHVVQYLIIVSYDVGFFFAPVLDFRSDFSVIHKPVESGKASVLAKLEILKLALFHFGNWHRNHAASDCVCVPSLVLLDCHTPSQAVEFEGVVGVNHAFSAFDFAAVVNDGIVFFVCAHKLVGRILLAIRFVAQVETDELQFHSYGKHAVNVCFALELSLLIPASRSFEFFAVLVYFHDIAHFLRRLFLFALVCVGKLVTTMSVHCQRLVLFVYDCVYVVHKLALVAEYDKIDVFASDNVVFELIVADFDKHFRLLEDFPLFEFRANLFGKVKIFQIGAECDDDIVVIFLAAFFAQIFFERFVKIVVVYIELEKLFVCRLARQGQILVLSEFSLEAVVVVVEIFVVSCVLFVVNPIVDGFGNEFAVLDTHKLIVFNGRKEDLSVRFSEADKRDVERNAGLHRCGCIVDLLVVHKLRKRIIVDNRTQRAYTY